MGNRYDQSVLPKSPIIATIRANVMALFNFPLGNVDLVK